MSEKLLMVSDYKEMSREQLEEFADKMRVERNSLTLELESLKEKLEDMNSPALGGTEYSESSGEQEDLEEPLGGPVLG